MKLKQCRCGNKPTFKSRTQQVGHGEIDKYIWLECSCGLRTIDITEGWEGTNQECIVKATNIWNGNEA